MTSLSCEAQSWRDKCGTKFTALSGSRKGKNGWWGGNERQLLQRTKDWAVCRQEAVTDWIEEGLKKVSKITPNFLVAAPEKILSH